MQMTFFGRVRKWQTLLWCAGLVSAAPAMSADDAALSSPNEQGAVQASGQVTNPTVTDSSVSSSGEQTPALQEVVVTAQKRTQNLQDVPLSVSAISGDALLQQNSLGAEDYLPQVPGVALDQVASGKDQITIRGIATGFGTNPLVGITIDQVPFGTSLYASLGSSILPQLDPMVLDRIEVLRGPQGTLYGANAMGGLINFITNTPSTAQSTGSVELDASTVAHGNQGYGVRAAYSTPLVADNLAMQISAFDRQDPGYISDPLQGRSDVNEAHVSGGRIALDGRMADFLTIKFSALYQQTSSGGSNMVDIGLSGTPLYGPYEHERMPGTDGLDDHLQFYTLNLQADLGPVSLTSLTGYQRLFFSNPEDYSTGFGPLLPLFYPGATNLGLALFNVIHTNRWTQEFRLASSEVGRLQYLAGVFYSGENNDVYQQLAPETYTTGAAVTSLPEALIAYLQQNYTQYAAFANLTLHVTDRFDISAGGRYSHNDQNISQAQSGVLIGPTVSSKTVSSVETPTTYSFTAQYHLDPQKMLYGRIASGYRAGGPNFSYPPGHATFDPDTTVNYEAGLKTEWWNRRLIVNPALYYIDWSKIQVFQTTSTGLNYYTNGGKAVSKGLELSVEAVPLIGLRIAGNVSYDDAKLTQDAPPNTFYGLAGQQLPFAAEWTANLSSDYTRPVTGETSVFCGFTATYTGTRVIDFPPVATVPRFSLPSYTTVDFRFGADINSLRMTLFVHNVGDTRGFIGGTDLTSGFTNSPNGPWAAALIPPRTVGMSFSEAF